MFAVYLLCKRKKLLIHKILNKMKKNNQELKDEATILVKEEENVNVTYEINTSDFEGFHELDFSTLQSMMEDEILDIDMAMDCLDENDERYKNLDTLREIFDRVINAENEEEAFDVLSESELFIERIGGIRV